jgi:hypothetical protein
MRNRLKPPCIVALLALLCACGSSNSPPRSHGSHATTQRPPPPTGEGSLERDTVAAVSPGGADPPIGLRFRLETKPVVGVPAQLVLALLPTPGVEISHIHGALQSAEGLQLQSARTFDIDNPQAGAPIEQDVTVVPQRNGVLSFSATVQVDYDNGSLSRTYVIPLIAANNPS